MKKSIIAAVAIVTLAASGSAMANESMMMSNDSMMMADNAMMAEEGVMVGGAMMIESRDIVDNAVLANNVTTVVAAVKAAWLVDTLKSAGPFTVFAPNNMAFEKLPAGTVESLLKTENKAMLVDILTYHVVAGSYKSSDLTDGLMLTTVEGKKLKFTKANGKLMINGAAMVETADVISKNGVTHVIDTVLLPPKEEAMMEKPMANSGMMKKMKGTVASIAAHYGYNWKKDRASLAAQIGIQNYRGTLSQNLKIRAHLLQMDTMMMQK